MSNEEAGSREQKGESRKERAGRREQEAGRREEVKNPGLQFGHFVIFRPG